MNRSGIGGSSVSSSFPSSKEFPSSDENNAGKSYGRKNTRSSPLKITAFVIFIVFVVLLWMLFPNQLDEVQDNVARISTETTCRAQRLQQMKSSVHQKWLSDITLSNEAWCAWDAVEIQLVIIAWNRDAPLSRLLKSLSNSDYTSDVVPMHFSLDGGYSSSVHESCKKFKWKHGGKTIHARKVNVGLIHNIVGSVTISPKQDPRNSWVIILEDDIEVSPSFYLWAKLNILRSSFPRTQLSERIYGISLYTPRARETLKPKIFWDPHVNIFSDAYLHQLPCSWGAAYNVQKWQQFSRYIKFRLEWRSELEVGIYTINGEPSTTNGWAGSWKKYFIEYILWADSLMLYPNFPNQTAFSTNHMELGVHVDPARKKQLEWFKTPLITMQELQNKTAFGPIEALPIYNLFNDISEERSRSIIKFFAPGVHPCPHQSDIHASYTTTPQRLESKRAMLPIVQLLKQSLHLQKINILVPEMSKRMNASYTVPKLMQDFHDFKIVHLHRIVDIGPGSKYLRNSVDTPTLVIDDDTYYSANIGCTYMKFISSKPDGKLIMTGFRGVNLLANGVPLSDPSFCATVKVSHPNLYQDGRVNNSTKTQRCDIITAMGSVVVPPFRTFHENFLSFTSDINTLDRNIMTNDDVWFNAFMAYNGVRRVLIPWKTWMQEMPFQYGTRLERVGGLEFKENGKSKDGKRENTNRVIYQFLASLKSGC